MKTTRKLPFKIPGLIDPSTFTCPTFGSVHEFNEFVDNFTPGTTEYQALVQYADAYENVIKQSDEPLLPPFDPAQTEYHRYGARSATGIRITKADYTRLSKLDNSLKGISKLASTANLILEKESKSGGTVGEALISQVIDRASTNPRFLELLLNLLRVVNEQSSQDQSTDLNF